MPQDRLPTEHELLLIEQPPLNFTRQETLAMIKKMSACELLRLRKAWREMPGLQDQGPAEKTAFTKRKDKQLQDMMNTDWPNGLHLLQLFQVFNNSHKVKAYLHYRVTLREYNHLLLSMTKDEVVERVREYFDSIQKNVYIYGDDTETENVYVCYISHLEKKQVFTCYFMFSPTVPCFVLKGKIQRGNSLELLKGAISSLYEVRSMNVAVRAFYTFRNAAESLQKESSSGLFSELKGIDAESSPLDIASKLKKIKKTKYVSGMEVSRRIIALDEEEIKKRLELKDANFGEDSPVEVQRLLKINIINSLDRSTGDDEQEDLDMDIVFKGKNVGIGLKKLVERGVIKAPCLWLETYASERTDELRITTDGVERFAFDV